MKLEVFTTPGLGDNTYLLVSGDEAVLVDPQRDVWRFLDAVDRLGATLRYVAETHVHNDYVSGAIEAQSATRAKIAAPAKGRYAFSHMPMAERDELRVGDHRLVAIDTPGHTPEHISWLAYEDGVADPLAAFTGGSLLVGGAGRTDLLGTAQTDDLTRAQFRTMRRFAELPDTTQVLPTHGAGSFCVSGSGASQRTSSIGDERRGNPALTMADERLFFQRQLTGLPDYPAYYQNMAPINRNGPLTLGKLPRPQALDPEAFASRIERGEVWIVDARQREAFAAAHIPGAVNVGLHDSFATYVGWVLPFNTPLVLVLPDGPEAIEEAVVQLARIGFERIDGYLDGGIEAWTNAGRAIQTYPATTVDDLCRALEAHPRPQVLDVRQRGEWGEGHVEGSQHLFVGDLPSRTGEVPEDGETWVICHSGYRSSVAASLLARTGRSVRLVSDGGVPDVLAGCG